MKTVNKLLASDVKRKRRECRICLVEKDFIYSHLVLSSHQKKFRDASGRVWNARTCPDCQANKVARIQRLRKKKGGGRGAET